MKLSSASFQNNGLIPAQYTCDGSNVNPQLTIEDVPSNAVSLVLIMDDPDIPDFVKQSKGIEVWDHWIVFNILPETNVINEAENPQATFGKNSGGENKYGGPCPPDKEHRYFFKLYALDTMLSLTAGSTKKQVEDAMQGHILEQAELIGRYDRK